MQSYWWYEITFLCNITKKLEAITDSKDIAYTLGILNTSLAKIGKHQVEHLKKVKEQGAIAFVIISFSKLREIYLLDANYLIACYTNLERKSIPYSYINEHGHLIDSGYFNRVDYLKVLDEYYL